MSTSSVYSVSSNNSYASKGNKMASKNPAVVQLVITNNKKNKENKGENPKPINENDKRPEPAMTPKPDGGEANATTTVKDGKKKQGHGLKSPKKRQHISVADFGLSKFGNFSRPVQSSQPNTSPTKLNSYSNVIHRDYQSPNKMMNGNPMNRYQNGQNHNGSYTYPLEFLQTVGLQMSNSCGTQIMGPSYHSFVNRSPEPVKIAATQSAPIVGHNVNSNVWSSSNNYNNNNMYHNQHQNYSSYHNGGGGGGHGNHNNNNNNNYQSYNRNTNTNNNGQQQNYYQHRPKQNNWNGQHKNNSYRNNKNYTNHGNSDNYGSQKRNPGNLYYVKASDNMYLVGTPHSNPSLGCHMSTDGGNSTSYVADLALLDVEVMSSSPSLSKASTTECDTDSCDAMLDQFEIWDTDTESVVTEPHQPVKETAKGGGGGDVKKSTESKSGETTTTSKKKKKKHAKGSQQSLEERISSSLRENRVQSPKVNETRDVNRNITNSFKNGMKHFGSSPTLSRDNSVESVETIENKLYSTSLDSNANKKSFGSYRTFPRSSNEKQANNLLPKPPFRLMVDEKTLQTIANTQCHSNTRRQMSTVMKFHQVPGVVSESTFFSMPDRFLARAHLISAKDPPIQLLNRSHWDKVSQNIWNKFVIVQQTEEMYKKKMNLWRYLHIAVKRFYPRFALYLVGSTISGFSTDTSDVDMCLVSDFDYHEEEHRTLALNNLTELKKYLQNNTVFDDFQLIQAKVPILRFKDAEHKIEVDLNFNNSVGIRNTHLLFCYTQMDWRLRPLVLIVKIWAQFHNINDARNSTMSSYSLALMVIHFLQCGVQPAILPCLHALYPDKFANSNKICDIDMNEEIEPYRSENQQTLGELFLQFLQYYSHFEYHRHAISIRTGTCLPIDECRFAMAPKNDPSQWKIVCIEEPFDLTNTARSVYDYEIHEGVKGVFRTSYHYLNDTLDLDMLFTSPFFIPPRHGYYSNPPSPNPSPNDFHNTGITSQHNRYVEMRRPEVGTTPTGGHSDFENNVTMEPTRDNNTRRYGYRDYSRDKVDSQSYESKRHRAHQHNNNNNHHHRPQSFAKA